MANPGTQAATRTDPGRRNQQNSGKSNGAGANALTGAVGGQNDQNRDRLLSGGPDTTGSRNITGSSPNASGGQASTAEGRTSLGAGTTSSDAAPTFKRTAPPQELPPGIMIAPSGDDTYTNTGRLKTMGTGPYVADPSMGQIVDTMLSAVPLAGTANMVLGTARKAMRGDDLGSGDTGLVGQSIDEERGVTPGSVSGYVGSPVASSTNARGDVRQSDDTRLMDRGAAPAAESSTGDVTTGGDDGGAEFSSVKLADRRRPYDATSAVDLLRGLL